MKDINKKDPVIPIEEYNDIDLEAIEYFESKFKRKSLLPFSRYDEISLDSYPADKNEMIKIQSSRLKISTINLPCSQIREEDSFAKFIDRIRSNKIIDT